MDYLQEDPYAGQRYTSHDPYNSGGGGFDSSNYQDNSFDRHNEYDRNMKNYQMANGGPYGSNGDLYSHNQQAPMRASPQPPRDGSYAGSRGSFQGPAGSEPYHSSNYNDPYGDQGGEPPRYNGGVHYPEDNYERDPRDEVDYIQNNQNPNFYGSGEPSFHDQIYPEDAPNLQHQPGPPSHHSGDFRDTHNRSNGPADIQDDMYGPSFQQHQQHPQQHPNNSFNDPRHDSYQDPYDPDRFSDAGRDGPRSGNYAGNTSYQDRPPSRPNDSFREDMGGEYVDDPHRRFEGLPPVRTDPFADDPFREQHSREYDPRHEPQFRGQSPAGGPDPVPYDERDAPDPYIQSAPRYPDEYVDNRPPQEPYYTDDVLQRMDNMHLGQPPPGQGVRNPDLQEVIDFLHSPDDAVKASAAAHLQHLTYMDDPMKAKARSVGAIRPLIRLLSHELVEVHKNACGALQNLSYGKNNIDNKREIRNENGIPELIRLLRKTDQEDVKDSVTGVLWNLSSCEDLKQAIIEDGLSVLVNSVILKYSGWSALGNASHQMPWTTVCRNTTGILRNVSSAGFDARKRLRECRGLVNSLIYVLKLAAEDKGSNDIDNKVVENTVCVLRNLSYRIQEVVDPDFFKKRSLPRQQQTQGGKAGKGKENNAGCFGNKSSKANKTSQNSGRAGNQPNSAPPQLPPASVEYRSLWGAEIHTLYSTVLKRCTNPITMEAAAGAIQNLTACDWQPAVESRAMVRKEKGLPLLVDLLSAESDRVVCATATALRNLAIDEKNKELVGKYAIRQLVSRLPRDNRNNLPDDTICAVVATLYEVVKDNQDFALPVVQEDGLPRLMHINKSEGRYLPRTLKFTLTLLKTLWGFKSLHAEYAKFGYNQFDFTTSRAYPRQQDSSRADPDVSRTPGSSNHTTPYNTLSRPMSAQGYDDNTLTPAMSQHHRNMLANQQPPPPSYLQQGHQPQDDSYARDIHRSNASLHSNRDRLNYSRDHVPHEDIPLTEAGPGYAPLDEPRPHSTKPPVGGVPLFPSLQPAESPSPSYGGDPRSGSEPLYAQVNKGSRRRVDQFNDPVVMPVGHHSQDSGGGADSWV